MFPLPASARGSRARFGGLAETHSAQAKRHSNMIGKFAMARTRPPARERGALPGKSALHGRLRFHEEILGVALASSRVKESAECRYHVRK
jgi:hypothetical protein